MENEDTCIWIIDEGGYYTNCKGTIIKSFELGAPKICPDCGKEVEEKKVDEVE